VGNVLIDLKGKIFGRLTVQSRHTENDKRGRAQWLCRCECGTEVVVMSSNLKHGTSKSCGCLRGEITSKRTRKLPYGLIYNRLCYNAKKRNISVELTYLEYLTFTKYDKCHYCRAPLTWTAHINKHKKNSSTAYNLDRMDNFKSYSLSNCIPCCRRCNMAKGNLYTHEDWYGMTGYLRMKNAHVELTEAA
jgi:hypothetical protein